jgi:hypothetical protein
LRTVKLKQKMRLIGLKYLSFKIFICKVKLFSGIGGEIIGNL